MHLPRFAIMGCGAGAAFLQPSPGVGFTLLALDEQATQLISPASAGQAIPVIQYRAGGAPTFNLVTATPLLCANTAAPSPTPGVWINTIFYSAHGSIGPSPLPFVFGASSATPSRSDQASGATNIKY